MQTSSVIPTELRDSALFMVWGPPSHGPRSRVFASELGIPIEFVYSTRRRGMLVAPWKYTYQAVRTASILMRRRPSLLFVQSPPSFVVLAAWMFSLVSGSRFVVDAHSGAFLSPHWERPRWLRRFLARRALSTIVTNERFAQQIRDWGGTASVLRDIPTTFAPGEALPRDDRFTVMVVSTFAADEPLAQTVEAAREVSDVHFYVTGNLKRADPAVVARAPGNVEFTGFIPDDVYYGTMNAADAVLCLTTRDNTMQRGACEALSMGRPIITSDWELLRSYFSEGTVHVDATADAIAEGVRRMRSEHERMTAEIRNLQRRQQEEWIEASDSLARLIRG
jgi:glycosyltransferase involved in cell wall biosynthesis